MRRTRPGLSTIAAALVLAASALSSAAAEIMGGQAGIQAVDFSGDFSGNGELAFVNGHWIELVDFLVIGPEVPNMPAMAFRRTGRMVSEDQLHQQIAQVLQTTHDARAGDAWTWRDTIEDRLMAFGPSALPLFRSELDHQTGLTRDALQVTVFRMDNAPLNPRDLLQEWAFQQFAMPQGAQDASKIKISRVMATDDLFPHHLFYTVELVAKKTRLPVALAADGKVQALADDAALEKFFHAEAAPQGSDVGKKQLAQIAALLVLARRESVSTPVAATFESRSSALICTVHSSLPTAQAPLTPTGTASVTFTPAGAVQSIVSEPKTTGTARSPALAPPPAQ